MTDLDRLDKALSDRYTIEREIGSAGMATVYLAEDVRHHRKVAVKVLRPELAAALGAERFLREVEIAVQLTHPHILPLHDSGDADGLLYYVMPYAEGESLRDRLDREKQLPIAEALKIASEVADALGFAHEHDVIHRDIKPDNILLEAKHAVVADFGVARAIAEAGETRLTETGIALGTPAYLSPEQATGERESDGRTDVYALGCVLYEMLAGEAPFHGPTAQSIATKHLTLPPPPLTDSRPTVPVELAAVVSKALAKAPADRFATAGQFAEALDAALVHISAPRAAAKRGVPVGVVGAIAVVAIISLGVFLWKPWVSDEEGAAPARWAWTILADVEGSAPEGIRELVKSLLAGDIDATGLLVTLSEEDIQLGLERAMKPDTTRLSMSLAKELAERGRIATVFAPELNQSGDTYTLTLRAFRTASDSLLKTERVSARDDDALIQASRQVVERVTPVIALWMGEAGQDGKWNPPVTSSLMDALPRVSRPFNRDAGPLTAPDARTPQPGHPPARRVTGTRVPQAR